MSWFKTDDEFPWHEKTEALREGPCRGDSIALWNCSGCWSSRALKNGFVPVGVVLGFGFHPDAASELVRVRLWKPAELDGKAGYQFHDWADYQPSADKVQERREAAAERKARSRARLSTAKKQTAEAAPAQSKIEVDVGVSRRDHPTVTGVVTPESRTQSRTCLADAARERDRVNSSLSTSAISSTEASYARTRDSRFERPPVGEPPEDVAVPELPLFAKIRNEYGERYIRKYAVAAPSDNWAEREVARWCEKSAKLQNCTPFDLALRLLDGLFATSNPRVIGTRHKLGCITKNPGEFLDLSAALKPVAVANDGAEAVRRQQARQEAVRLDRERAAREAATAVGQ